MPAFDASSTDTGWVTLTHDGSGGSVQYRCRNGVMYVEGAVTIAMTSGVNVSIVSGANAIPERFRPAFTRWVPGRCDAGTLGAQVGRNNDGTIGAIQNQGSPATGVQFAYSYPIG